MGLLDLLRHRSAQPSPTAPAHPGSRPATPPAAWTPASGGFAIVDVETTGLTPGRDRVVELAVVITDHNGHQMDEWTTLINPGGPVGASHIHGITAADVRHAPTFAAIVGDLNARLAGRALVAHNARFDLAFITTEYARAGWTMPPSPHLCTLEASRTHLPHLDRRRLADCCWAAGIQLHDAHSALGDARATAALLATYLHSHDRHATTALHQLPATAARTPWPPIPPTNTRTVLRSPHQPAPLPAPAGTLAALLDDLPLTSVSHEAGDHPGIAPYLELLAEVLEDGVLTHDEATSLAALAKLYNLSREQVTAAHRGFLLALAHKAVEDGKITRDERGELLAATDVLGFQDTIVRDVLDEAAAALAAQRAQDCLPVPDGWAHHPPVRIGDGVAFTGCDELVRARLEGSARAAGLRVTGAVSGRTVVLVTDGADAGTTKAQAARRLGTRVVTPNVFHQLLAYVQPAHSAIAAPARADSSPLMPAATVAEAPSGSAIRAWARAHGLAVGTRGRIPGDVVAAYHAAAAPAQ